MVQTGVSFEGILSVRVSDHPLNSDTVEQEAGH